MYEISHHLEMGQPAFQLVHIFEKQWNLIFILTEILKKLASTTES